MSRFKEHIKIEELIALFDGNYELLPETIDHIKECEKCSGEMKKYESMIGFVKSERDISHFPDIEKIELIAEGSFKLLHSENEELPDVFAGRKRSISDIIHSFFKPLAIAGGAVAILAAVFFYASTESGRGADQFADVTPEIEESALAMEDPAKTDKEMKEPSFMEEGSIIKTGRAEIKVLATTFIGTVSENEVVMKEGKASFNVTRSDGDFKVEVLDRFTVKVLGTSFIIESDKTVFSISVTRGKVEVFDRLENSSAVLTANMDRSYKIARKIETPRKITVKRPEIVKPVIRETSKLIVTPDASFLKQGREALDAGRKGAALQLFIMELESGREKDRALFEISRIHSKENRNLEVVELLKKNREVLNSSSLYKEELLIRGCHAQHRSGIDDRSFCKQYLSDFPRGYKRSEIEGIVNGN